MFVREPPPERRRAAPAELGDGLEALPPRALVLGHEVHADGLLEGVGAVHDACAEEVDGHHDVPAPAVLYEVHHQEQRRHAHDLAEHDRLHPPEGHLLFLRCCHRLVLPPTFTVVVTCEAVALADQRRVVDHQRCGAAARDSGVRWGT